MKNKGYSSLASLSNLSTQELEPLIAGSNFYKTKARILLAIAKATNSFGGLEKILRIENREQLLSLEGIGEETADSSLLFAGNQLALPISVYVRRVLERVLNRKLSIRELRSLCQGSLPQDLYSYKLFYAGLSTVGKAFCRAENPNCAECILSGVCSFAKARLEK
jgi:endonuclease-3 related protein